MMNSLAQAIRYVEEEYGHIVTVDNAFLTKFGENPVVGTAEATIQEFLSPEKAETFVSGNDIDGIVCDDTFTGDVYVEGFTVADNSLTLVTQTVTMTSEVKAVLDTPLHRCTRLKNASGTDLPANSKVYAYASAGVSLSGGIPQTASSVKCIMSAAENQSLKCATSVSGTKYWFLILMAGGVNKKTQGGTVIRLKVRERGGVFQTKYKIGSNSLGAAVDEPFPGIQIIRPNSDVIMTAEADSVSTPIQGTLFGFLGTIQNA